LHQLFVLVTLHLTLMANPPVNRLPAELEYRLKFKKYEEIGNTVRTGIRFGMMGVLAYFAYRSIAVMAGQHTLADIAISFLANVKVNTAVAYLFGGAGILYGATERNTRQKTIERLSREKNSLERLVDPARSSSKLTERGTTRPEDET
jgi:hypothetical protein